MLYSFQDVLFASPVFASTSTCEVTNVHRKRINPVKGIGLCMDRAFSHTVYEKGDKLSEKLARNLFGMLLISF